MEGDNNKKDMEGDKDAKDIICDNNITLKNKIPINNLNDNNIVCNYKHRDTIEEADNNYVVENITQVNNIDEIKLKRKRKRKNNFSEYIQEEREDNFIKDKNYNALKTLKDSKRILLNCNKYIEDNNMYKIEDNVQNNNVRKDNIDICNKINLPRVYDNIIQSDSNNLNKYKGSSFALIIHEISDLLSLITTVDKSKNKNKIKLVNIGHKLNTLMRSHYERIYDCDNSLVSIINKIKKLYKCYRSMEEKYLKKTKKQNINININTNTNKIEKENVAGNNDEEDPNDGINILHDDLLKEEINNIDNNIKNDINKYTIKCNNNNEKLIQDPFFQNEFVQGIDNYINQKDENNCHDNIKDKIDTLNCYINEKLNMDCQNIFIQKGDYKKVLNQMGPFLFLKMLMKKHKKKKNIT
ncbi:hypothetical protein PFFCH_01903 [Plasmodium falciparum FCH/4]|uniref:Uncharacterized protein n=1 Tax=Plasmodium falciparum FCH/4 TaxID=1036724 RepID=A0A024VQU1_PLAFA|nr:hypothetical protein PFFCH_01903 [Plasmodium falciparum FCH/4]